MSKLSKMAAGSVIVATAALGGATLALADGSAPKKVAYERPADWSGVYFGVGSGYQWSSIDVDHVPGGVFPGTTGIGISSDHNDAFVSAHLGVQHQWGAIVLGIEGGWMSTLRDHRANSEFCDSVPAVLQNPILAPGDFCTARLNDIVTIGARVGWAAGRWMPYLTGGYANAGVDFENRIAAPGAAGVAGATILQEEAHARLNGWYIGGGVEWAVSPGWTAGIEYRHYDFGTSDSTAYSACTTTGTPGCPFAAVGLPQEKVRFDDTTDTISARVSWRWGREQAAAPLK
jgi:outer membrane immunogenic protein